MVLLENDTFLTELTRLYQKSRTTGTGMVQLTMKKYDGHDRPTPKARKPSKKSAKSKKGGATTAAGTTSAAAPKSQHHAHSEPPHMSCLIRAKLHNRKISTTVSSRDMTRFQMSFSNLLKGNLDGLKKVKKVKGQGQLQQQQSSGQVSSTNIPTSPKNSGQQQQGSKKAA